MIPKLEINDEIVNLSWKTKKERNNIHKWLKPFKEFKKFNVFSDSANFFPYCFKGHENIQGNMYMTDYGYALDPESIEKYIEQNNYLNDDNEYLVCCTLMSMDYEKYYKNGEFINKNGIKCGDFWELENSDELKDEAFVENYWLQYTIYDLNKDGSGEPLSKETPEWIIKAREKNNEK